jgi:hypothetical protein
MAKQLRQIGEVESFSNSVEFLAGKKVKSTFSFRRSAQDARYEKQITFDFSKLNEQQLMELALKAVQIKAQAMLRALDPAVMLDATVLTEIDVLKDVVSAEKKTADPVSQAVKSLMKATGCTEEVARDMMNAARQRAEARKTEAQKGKRAA